MLYRIPELPFLKVKSKRPNNRRYFGGGGSSVKSFDPYKRTGIRELYSQLGDWISPQIGQGVPAYQGQTVADISPLQQMGYGQASGIGDMSSLLQNYASGAINQQASGGGEFQQLAGSTLKDLMKPWDSGSATQYWNQAFVDPAIQNWQQNILPGVAEKYGTGGVGGSLGREMLRSGENVNTQLSGQLANILYSGEQAQLGRQQTGVNQAMNLAQMPNQLVQGAGQIAGQGTDQLSQLLNIGGQQQGQQQNLLNAEANKWTQSQPYNNPYLMGWLNTALQQQGMTPVVQQGSPGLGTSLAAGMMPALGTVLGSSMASGGLSGLIGASGTGIGAGGLATAGTGMLGLLGSSATAGAAGTGLLGLGGTAGVAGSGLGGLFGLAALL
jgi:hypothetical protein